MSSSNKKSVHSRDWPWYNWAFVVLIWGICTVIFTTVGEVLHSKREPFKLVDSGTPARDLVVVEVCSPGDGHYVLVPPNEVAAYKATLTKGYDKYKVLGQIGTIGETDRQTNQSYDTQMFEAEAAPCDDIQQAKND